MNKTITNIRFCKELYPKFEAWFNENNFFIDIFEKLADNLESFYTRTNYLNEDFNDIRPLLKYLDSSQKIVQALPNTLDCQNVDFSKWETAAAYAIWHFLDRYTRFNTVYLKLLKIGILPVRYSINALDVATGPASSIFALSDIYMALTLYGYEHNVPELINIKFRPDYVENSDGFRTWIHFFTEHANRHHYRNTNIMISQKNPFWKVPYHLGNFYNLYETNFQNIQWWHRRIHGFNVVTIANFIIPREELDYLINFLESVVYGSKNGGIIIIIGSGKQYNLNMEELIKNNRFKKLKMKKIRLPDSYNNTISFPRSIRVAEKMNKFYQKIHKKLEIENWLKELDKKSLGNLENRMKNRKLKGKWEIHVFRKGELPKNFESLHDLR